MRKPPDTCAMSDHTEQTQRNSIDIVSLDGKMNTMSAVLNGKLDTIVLGISEIKDAHRETKDALAVHEEKDQREYDKTQDVLEDLKRFKWMTLGVVACIEFFHQIVEHAHK